MVENDQKPGAAQPVREYHTPAVHGTYLGAWVGADHNPVPLGTSVATAGITEACQQSTIDWPWKFAPRSRKCAAVVRAIAGNHRPEGGAGLFRRFHWLCGLTGPVAGSGGGQRFLLAAFFCFLLCQQGLLACLFSFTRLAGEGFLDGLQDFGQVGLVLFARLQLLIAVFYIAVELCQYLLALGALGFQGLAAAIEVGALGQQLLLLAGNFLFDVGQLAQGLVEGAQLLQARLAQVVVIGEGAGEFLGVLLVEQQLEVFLATVVLVSRTGLNGDQSLLFNAGALEFFFLGIKALQLAFSLF
ncbi:hypothetical protein D9M71_380260 [compost metagenome]